MDAISACQEAASRRVACPVESAEELIQLESQIAFAKKEVMRNCPLIGVSLNIAGEKTRDYHLNVFEVVKLKMGIDHQQWRTDSQHR